MIRDSRRNALVLLMGLLVTLLACKGTPEKTYKVGDTIEFDDSKWQVVKAENIGSDLQGITGAKKTAGRFVKVEFTVTNTGKQDESILDHPKVFDDQSRSFGPMDDQSLYLPEREQTLTLETLPPSIMKRFTAIYEVPPDAKTLQFEARALSAFGSKKKVALGI